MPRKRHKPEEIVAKLRQVDVLVAQGQSVADAVRAIGVTEVTYYRWRQEFGGLKTEQIKRLKELETENARLARAVADLTLDKLILKEAAPGSSTEPRAAPRLHRARPRKASQGFRASCLCGARLGAAYMFSACCAFGGCGGAIVVIHALDGSRRCREAEEGRACRVG